MLCYALRSQRHMWENFECFALVRVPVTYCKKNPVPIDASLKFSDFVTCWLSYRVAPLFTSNLAVLWRGRTRCMRETGWSRRIRTRCSSRAVSACLMVTTKRTLFKSEGRSICARACITLELNYALVLQGFYEI